MQLSNSFVTIYCIRTSPRALHLAGDAAPVGRIVRTSPHPLPYRREYLAEPVLAAPTRPDNQGTKNDDAPLPPSLVVETEADAPALVLGVALDQRRAVRAQERQTQLAVLLVLHSNASVAGTMETGAPSPSWRAS